MPGLSVTDKVNCVDEAAHQFKYQDTKRKNTLPKNHDCSVRHVSKKPQVRQAWRLEGGEPLLIAEYPLELLFSAVMQIAACHESGTSSARPRRS